MFIDLGLSALCGSQAKNTLDIFLYGYVMFRHGKSEHYFGRLQRGR